MAINDTLQLSVIGFVNGTQHIHTLHGRAMTVDNAADAFISLWNTGCAPAYRQAFRTGEAPIQLLKAQVVCGSLPLPAGSELAVTGANSNGQAEFAGAPEPAYMAALVSVKSELSGRRRQGRFFIGGLGKNDTVANLLTAGAMGRIQGYVDAVRATFVTPAAPAVKLVVHSRYLSSPHAAYTDANGVNHPAYTPGNCQDSSAFVAQLIVKDRATTMRSRKLGHGL